MGTTINYQSEVLRTIDAVSSVRIYDATTGKYTEKAVTRFNDKIQIHGYQYTANGKVHTVSMAQLFMTVCMNRANDIEAETVTLMAKMSDNTTKLTELADLEDIVLNNTISTIPYVAIGYFNCPVPVSYGGSSFDINFEDVARETGLTLPEFVPLTGDTSRTILTEEQFEQYKTFLHDVIKSYRALSESDINKFKKTLFYDSLSRTEFFQVTCGKDIETAFNLLFGSNDSTFEYSYWYLNCANLKRGIGRDAELYKVGNHAFDSLTTKYGVYGYAQNTYSIDMSKSQSEVTQALESKMDEYNSISQEDMIELQSLVSKRDQSYTLISNALKSMYNSNLSAANNLK